MIFMIIIRTSVRLLLRITMIIIFDKLERNNRNNAVLTFGKNSREPGSRLGSIKRSNNTLHSGHTRIVP